MRQSIFKKDLENKQMLITRIFDAPIEKVWRAWTDPSIVDLWWAPKPWKAVTKHHELAVGGEWLYCMQGPEGEQHWAKAVFKRVEAPYVYEGSDAFCDEHGVSNEALPSVYWRVEFEAMGEQTLVKITNTFESAEAIETIISMGFQEGFSMAHGNLDALIEGGLI